MIWLNFMHVKIIIPLKQSAIAFYFTIQLIFRFAARSYIIVFKGQIPNFAGSIINLKTSISWIFLNGVYRITAP